MKKKIIIIAIILLVILLGIGIYLAIKINKTNQYQNADIYNVNGEEFISVKKAIGDTKLKKYSYEKDTTETLVLTFKTDNKEELANNYINYLLDNGNYIQMRTDNDNKRQIAKSADNSSNLVTIETEIIEDGFKVTIVVGPGTIVLDSFEE